MEKYKTLHSKFESAITYYSVYLKNEYFLSIEKATDKDYATIHYRSLLFEQYEYIPYYTVFFQELIATFDHFQRLDTSKAIEHTFGLLHTIKESSMLAHEDLMVLLMSKSIESYEDIDHLPEIYVEAINDPFKRITLNDLASLEKMTFTFDNETTVRLLALYRAIQLLKNDPDIYPENEFVVYTNQTPSKEYKNQITRNQQVLLFYYFLKMAGIDPRVHAHVTSCAELLHGLAGIPYNNITNSELYKKLKNPLDNAKPEKTIQDLHYVRSVFLKFQNEKILKEIDKDIKGLSME